MKKKLDKTIIGFIAGIIVPPLAYFIFCFFSFYGESAIDLLKGYASRHLLTHIISLAALANLPLFYGFLRLDSDRSAKGVIAATMIYFLVIAFLKLK
jgi:hypothetical protein